MSAVPVASLAPTRVGTETRINATTAGEQFLSATTSLTGGGYVVLWTTYTNNTSEVWARRYGADGQPAGAEFIVSTNVGVNKYQPSATALAGGGFAVTWAQSNATQAQIFDASGSRVGSEFQVSGSSTYPNILALANGGLAVTWSVSVGPFDQDVYARLFTATGTPTTLGFIANTSTAYFQGPSKLVALGSGFVIVWDDNRYNNGDNNIIAQRFDASGAKIGGEFQINTTTPGNQFGSRVASLSDGGFVVTWYGDGIAGAGSYAQRYNSSGVAVGNETLLTSLIVQDVFALPGGGYMVTTERFDSDGSYNNVYAQRFNANGTPHGSAFLVNTTLPDFQEHGQIAVLANGDVVVTWQSNAQDGDGWGVYSQWFDDDIHANVGEAFNLKGMMQVLDDGGAGAQETVVISVSYGILNVDAGQPNGSGINVTGSGTNTVTLQGSLAIINAVLNTLQASVVQYVPTGGSAPTSATLTMTVTDGDNQTSTVSQPIYIVSNIANPVAYDDGFAITESAVIQSGNLFADHGSGADVAPPGQTLSVAAINGVSASVGQTITLASGAILTARADGTFDYNPNGAFDYLPSATSGASNLTGTDSFTYALTNGNTATVTITLSGLDSNDTLRDTPFNDTLRGGIGNDTYYVSNVGDQVIENANEGTDTVMSLVDFTLGANVENLTLIGTGNTIATGNSGNNVLHGNSGNNYLYGGGGTDTLYGGLGDDVFIVDSADDVVIEYANEGSDLIKSSVSYTLAANSNIESLRLAGNANINATGDAGFNKLVGNPGDNILDGGGGGDVLRGGLGNDTYIVRDATDRIVEVEGNGTDVVKAAVSYVLESDAWVESLMTIDAAATTAINLTGNGHATVIQGNAGANVLTSGSANETLTGFGGADIFKFVAGNGQDTVGDFVSGTDKLDLSAFFTSFAAFQAATNNVGGNAVVTLGGGNSVTLTGVLKAQIALSDVIVSGGGAMVEGNAVGNDTYAKGLIDAWAHDISLGALRNVHHLGFADAALMMPIV